MEFVTIPIGLVFYNMLAPHRCRMEHKRSTERTALYKLLKTWGGRPGSNRRRPVWEYDSKLETKNIAFPRSCNFFLSCSVAPLQSFTHEFPTTPYFGFTATVRPSMEAAAMLV
jgi:hypothetical protein